MKGNTQILRERSEAAVPGWALAARNGFGLVFICVFLFFEFFKLQAGHPGYVSLARSITGGFNLPAPKPRFQLEECWNQEDGATEARSVMNMPGYREESLHTTSYTTMYIYIYKSTGSHFPKSLHNLEQSQGFQQRGECDFNAQMLAWWDPPFSYPCQRSPTTDKLLPYVPFTTDIAYQPCQSPCQVSEGLLVSNVSSCLLADFCFFADFILVWYYLSHPERYTKVIV